MFKNILMVAIALSLPLHGRANDLHLKVPEKSHEVLAPKANALTLKDIEAKLINEQLDLQISYEKLLQAQKKIGQARAQYFPYGVGTVAAMYFLNIWNPLILVELVTSLPSKIYNVQTEKNMKMAEYYSNEALKENIKNQVAHLYYNILKEESVLKLAKMELTLLETLYKVTEERVAAGLASEQDLRSLELRLLDLRDICLKFAGYLSAEKMAFNTMISQMPEDAKKIELQTAGNFLNPSEYALSSEILKLNAVDRSPEIVAADYMITAAAKSKNSTAWSVLSFNGIGFGYWGRMQVAASKIDQARLNRKEVETNLANQTYITNNSFHRTMDHFVSEKDVFADTASHFEAQFAKFQAGDIALDKLIETELVYLKDFRDLVVAHYETMKKHSDLERLALSEVKGSEAEDDKVQVNFDHMNNSKYSLSVKSDEKIKSVEYVFENAGLNTMTLTNKHTNFGVILKLSSAKDFAGHVNVNFEDGSTLTKLFKF